MIRVSLTVPYTDVSNVIELLGKAGFDIEAIIKQPFQPYVTIEATAYMTMKEVWQFLEENGLLKYLTQIRHTY